MQIFTNDCASIDTGKMGCADTPSRIPLPYRQQLIEDCEPILNRFNYGVTPTMDDAHKLRDLWECSKKGNLLTMLLEDMCFNPDETIQALVYLPGFLSQHELWHTRRASGFWNGNYKTPRRVQSYRGCDIEEVQKVQSGDSFGLSWTLSLDVANFFAHRSGRKTPVVVKANLSLLCWLDTAEHEVIAVYADKEDIVDVSPAEIITIDWDNRPRLRPHQFMLRQE